MSASNDPKAIQGPSGSPPGSGITAAVPSASADSATNQVVTTGSGATLNLTTLDKIKRFFFSKEEWEAYLLEKLEEENKRQEEGVMDEASSPESEAKEESTDKPSVVSWLKTVFPSQDDANTFLKSQLEKLQEVKDNVVVSSLPGQMEATKTGESTGTSVEEKPPSSTVVAGVKPETVATTTAATAAAATTTSTEKKN